MIIFILLGLIFAQALPARAETTLNRPMQEVSAYELIIAMNTLRMSYGLPALIEDPIINAVAQSTAEIMAANQMSWHMGDVSGRLTSAGYGGGVKVWATENFAVGNMEIDEIMLVWSDDSHMIPAVNPAYCSVGAGTAKSSNGMTYYVLQAAYTSSKACGEYRPPGGTPKPGSTAVSGGVVVSQLIVPVKIATPDAEGKIFHEVKAGQSFWSIAVAYKITIKDLEIWNNITKDSKLQINQKLFIPSSSTKGYATPTPVGMILLSTPEPDGKMIHVVQSYQTLSTISQAYKVDIPSILALNGIQEDWPLQIGQKLIIKGPLVTPTATPQPLTPIQKLTPAEDGKYYHVIQSGETLSWIADLYKVNVFDLMAWNGLNDSSIVYPSQKLLLQVTPPATPTNTPGPPTVTLSATPTPSETPTQLPSSTSALSPTPATEETRPAGQPQTVGVIILAVGIVGVALVVFFGKRK